MLDAPFVAFLLIKAGLILGAAWLLQRVAVGVSAAVRHGIWAVSLLAALLLPVAPRVLPPLHVSLPGLPARAPASGAATPLPAPAPAPPRTPASASAAVTAQAIGAESAHPGGIAGAGPLLPAVAWSSLLVAIWLVGVVARLGWLGAQLARVSWLVGYARPTANRRRAGLARRLATRLRIARRVRLLESGKVSMPLTWGAARPVIVLPDETWHWPPERLRVVLLHELAHIRRWDYLTSLLAEAACALYWPIPLVWVARRRVQMEQEQACDDLVLESGTASIDYAEHLLAIARAFSGNRWEYGAAITMAREDSLKQRIRAILEKRTNRGPLLGGTGLFALTLLAGVVVPVAALRTAPEASAAPASAVARPSAAATDSAAAVAAIPAGPAYLWLEAEGAPRLTSRQRFTSLGASDGAFVVLGEERRSGRDGARTDAVNFDVRVPRDGRYHVWARIAGSRDDAGALAVSLDGSPPVEWRPDAGGWRWREVDGTFAIGAGAHTLRIAGADGRVALDRVLVTDDSLYRPADRGAPEPGFRARYTLLEAEKGEVEGKIQHALGDLSSGGGYLAFGSHRGEEGSATFVFDVDAPGRYVIWGRVVAPDDRANSFYASVDGGAEVVWDAPRRDPGRDARWWSWDPVSARDLDGREVDPLLFDLPPGRHTLRLRIREPGTRLDAILITNDLSHRPRGIWPATLPDAPVRLAVEAESAEMERPFEIGRDSAASGGRYLRVGRVGRDAKKRGDGSATLRFTVPQSGVYTLWARTLARNTDEDSFWLRVNGGPRTRWNEIPRGRAWRWSAVHDADRANQVAQFHLKAGVNTIELAGRESGVRLDRIVVTNDPLYEPGE